MESGWILTMLAELEDAENNIFEMLSCLSDDSDAFLRLDLDIP